MCVSTSIGSERADNVLSQRERRRQPGRLYAEHLDQPGHAVVGWALHDEVGGRFARADDLRAHSRVVGRERAVCEVGIVPAHLRGRPGGIDALIGCASRVAVVITCAIARTSS